MGIPQLLKFVKDNCSDYNKTIHISELAGKTIVIDTSIYMYQYKMKGALFDNFYLLSMLLLEYSIVPIFVFDGPKHFYKYNTIEKRKNRKKKVENQLKNMSIPVTFEDKRRYTKMHNRSIRITEDDTKIVKDLLITLGIMYIDAPYEADEICAILVLYKKAYACLSEDTDMFAYGCCNVLRTLNIFDETVVQYSMPRILRSLRLSQTAFREICIITGTDYNRSYGSMKKNYDRYMEYKRLNIRKGFFEWLFEKGEINAIIFLSKMYLKFDLIAANYEELKVFENMSLYKKEIFEHKIKLLLRKNYFVNP